MNTATKNIEVKRTGRYFTNEMDPASVETVWFVLHGYGQLAENFIKKFQLLDNEKNYLIAPEALSRFYADNGFGKIGASWMTREERDNEISDYTAYLTDLYKQVINELNGKKVKLNVFGFSQGTSTVCRWLQRSGIKGDKVILWGGFLPPDFNVEKWKDVFDSLLIVTGTDDQFFSSSMLEEAKGILDSHNVNYSAHIYEGIHEMKEKILNEVLAQF